MRTRAIVPIGTTFSRPVKAVPPGETVRAATSGVVVDDDGGVTVDPLTVVGAEVVDVICVVVAGVVVLEVCVVLVPAGQSVGEWPRTKSACPPSHTTWKET
jgi:hypothetical protein